MHSRSDGTDLNNTEAKKKKQYDITHALLTVSSGRKFLKLKFTFMFVHSG